MSIIAVIPARGGSKRIPEKNIIFFSGKPMIAWTIEAALKSACFTDVFVNTDCPEIAAISTSYGAKTVFLRDKYQDDHSVVSQATTYYMSELERLGYNFDTVCQLMANCPLRRASTIQTFCQYFIEREINELISVVKPKFGNPLWSIKKNSDSCGEFVFEDKSVFRSQDLPELYYPTGSIWLARKEKLKKTNDFYSATFNVKELSWLDAIDIDEPDELEIAEKLIQSVTDINT